MSLENRLIAIGYAVWGMDWEFGTHRCKQLYTE